MASYGISEQGFKAKRLQDILQDLKTELQMVQDPDSGQNLVVNFDENDPLIQITNLWADQLATLWELLDSVYSQFNPLNATGNCLSSIVQLNGIQRKLGSAAEVTLSFTGQVGVLIPKGTKITDSNRQVNWVTSVDCVLESDGTGSVLAYSESNGAFTAPAGSLNTFAEEAPLGVNAVINNSDAVPGAANESDIVLRQRRILATETPSRSILESLYSGVRNLPNVEFCKIYTNRTLTTDTLGIPPKHIAVIVSGGDDTEIAGQILLRASLGEEFYGDPNDSVYPYSGAGGTAVNVTDSLGVVTTVSFIRPAQISIDLQIQVSSIEGTEFPDDYAEQITKNVIAFAKNGISGLGVVIEDSNSFDAYGFPPAEDVVLSRLYTPILACKGVKVVNVTGSVHGQALSSSDIPIDWDEVALFDAANITVTRS